jgi:predicted nuclease with TOPRIM domain
MNSLTKMQENLEELRQENQKGLFEIIGMKDDRLSYQEARIEAMQKEIEKLNIEIINLEIKIQLLEDGINK